jgi:hypothetical protein
MNFSEFKKLLGADPLNSDAETLRARESGAEFEEAAIEAARFEEKLRAAINVSPQETDFVENLISVSQRSKRSPRWFAIAASVLILIGVASVTTWQMNQPKTIEEYVAMHYAEDGEALLERAEAAFDPSKVSSILAAVGINGSDEFKSRVLFIRHCPTLAGRGAHMIVQSDNGPLNVIYMPGTVAEDRRTIAFGDMRAYMVAFAGGTATVIGRADQLVSGMDNILRTSLSSTI